MNDLIIIGGGPAGVAGAVYAARKQLRTVLITEEFGGQSSVSEGIENWVGTINISGADLAKSFKAHVEALKSDVVTVMEGVRVEALTGGEQGFTATTTDGATVTAKAVLIASGAARKRLEVPGADAFEHKGVTYCASCDGPVFSGMDVAVVGGGNAGFESALQLLAYCSSVTLIHRRDDFKADPVTVSRALAHPNMRVLTDTEPVRVDGEKFVTGLTVRNRLTGEETTLPVAGVFVEIGVIPNTGFVKELVALDPVGHIVTNPRDQKVYAPEAEAVTLEGIWAAGDVTDELYHQNNIAAGDAVKALEDIYLWLKTH
ncbi:MAG TPA: FAD-dependent oxidoreductase [Candidatus Paceibacterota bacterium]